MTQETQDTLYNAILVGMTIPEACIFAGLMPDDLLLLESHEWQARLAQWRSSVEQSLLSRMFQISRGQSYENKESATVWLLEHLYPKYNNKQQSDGNNITIVTSGVKEDDTVEVVRHTEGGADGTD